MKFVKYELNDLDLHKVSILILTHNRCKLSKEFIPKIIENIGETDTDVLIWDNGSTDGSFDWLCCYGLREPRVSFVCSSPKNYGLEAINFLAEQSKSKYIVKVDDDIEVPFGFVDDLIQAYEEVNDERLLHITYDMKWHTGKSFALRSGRKVFKRFGEIRRVGNKHEILIIKKPSKFMVNGVCRLCEREKFLNIGGHPAGCLYGIDKKVSEIAEQNEYWCAFLNTGSLIEHKGVDSKEYREFKDRELRRIGASLHV